MADITVEPAEIVRPLGAKGDAAPKPAFTLAGRDAGFSLNLWFAVTTIAGALSEVAGEPYLAAASMVAYLVYGFAIRRSIGSIERLADSTYYQGFILTIFALFLALSGKGGNTITSNAVIQQFGLAILTTFVGMTGRIVIIQFLVSPVDDGDAAEAATVALVRSMEAATIRLDAAVDSMARKIDAIDIPTDILARQVHQATGAMNDALGRMREELGQGTRSLAESLKSDAAILRDMRADFDAIKQALLQANGAIREASRTIGQGLDGTRDNLAAAKEAARGLEQLGETAAGLDFRLKGFSEALGDSAAARADEMKRASKQMVAAAGQVVGEADRVAEALIRGTRGIADAVRDAGRISGSPQ